MSRVIRRRAGFTLVELLVVVAIITLVAATALFTMWGATEQAKAARTRTLVDKIDMVIMRQWDTYATRRINVNPGGTSRRHRAFSRLAAIRELQRMELPERRADLMVQSQIPGTFQAVGQRTLRGPALWHAYRRKVARTYNPSWQPGDPVLWANWSPEFQGSECLYLILTHLRDQDSTGFDNFKPSDFGDTDGDLMPEVLDGWKRPIEFLRWAPGYLSDPSLIGSAARPMATDQTADATLAPDPFDALKSDPRWSDADVTNDPFMLKPLVYSAGADRIYDIAAEAPDASGNPTVDHSTLSTDIQSAATAIVFGINTLYMTNDPYRNFPVNASTIRMGTPGGAAAGDNITNHYVEVR